MLKTKGTFHAMFHFNTLCVITLLFALYDAKILSKDYVKIAGSKVVIPCAAIGSTESNAGVMSNDITEECTLLYPPLPTVFTADFTYLVRKTTIVEFDSQSDWQSFFENRPEIPGYAWRLPGAFGVGASLEVHFKLPTTPWNRFHFQIFDAFPEESTLIPQNSANKMLAHSAIRTYSVNTNSHNGVRFYDVLPVINPIPYINGPTYVTTYQVLENGIKVVYSNTLSRLVPHIADPLTAKAFVISGIESSFPIVEKIKYTSL